MIIRSPLRDDIENPEYELWLKIGQSNSIGRSGDMFITPDVLENRVLEINHATGNKKLMEIPAQDQLTALAPNAVTPPFLSFGKRRILNNPNIKSVLLVNRGLGGTGFSNNRWNSGNDLYTAAVNELNATKAKYPHYTFKGILWHQGETDAIAGWSQSTYQTALGNMVTSMRASVGNVPFILGTMSQTWINLNTAQRQPIDNAHRNHAAYITDSHLVDLSDLAAAPDNIHFTNASYRTMGVRYAEAIV